MIHDIDTICTIDLYTSLLIVLFYLKLRDIRNSRHMLRLRAQHFLLTRRLRARYLRKNITNMTFPQPSKMVTLESTNGEKSKKCTLWKIPGNILY
uniref:Secreted protein n=1 Tax=Loa loa TaxID=7209 RepID=A0A1I7V8U7_LOALO